MIRKAKFAIGKFQPKLKSRRLFSVADKYHWTEHSRIKMRQYGLSEARIKRIIRFPQRIEEGVLENTVAVMQPISPIRSKEGKLEWKREIWAMYKLDKYRSQPRLRIITAWRYPGVSPARDPVPAEIIREAMALL